MSSTRERCKCCQRFNPVGFDVPESIWLNVAPEEFQNKVLCIMCFDMFAAEKNIQWDDDVKFYPVSQRSMHEWCELTE